MTNDGGESQAGRQHYRIPFEWCLLSGLIIFSFHTALPGGRSVLMPVTGQTVLSEPGDWHIPATQIEWTREWSSLSYPLMVLLGALFIGFLTQSLMTLVGFGTGMIAMVSLSYGFESWHFLNALLLTTLANVFQHVQNNSEEKLTGPLLILILAMAVLTTLEIGVACLFWLLLFVPYLLTVDSKRWFKQSAFWGTISGLLLLFIGGSTFGFWQTLIRPWSAVASPVYPELFDSLAPIFGAGIPTVGQMLLVLTLLVCWSHAISGIGSFRSVVACLSLFTFLGLLCGYYLWLSVVASLLCLKTKSQTGKASGVLTKRASILRVATALGIILICLLKLSGPGTLLRQYLFEGTLAAHRIDPTEWPSEGPALLLDLDRCSEWLDVQMADQYPPIIDNRWDLYGDRYADYAELSRDLKEMRALLYFRTDQKFGGYLHRIKDWKPLLVVAETREQGAIRDLSLSPHWKMLGIDGQTTYFGRDTSPLLRQQIRTAGRTFLNLEWPDGQATPPSPQVIAASTPADATRVAGAMNAIRLPYAALHMLPSDLTVERQKLRVWAYLELSYRVLRNTEMHSLLDEFRALRLIRELALQKQWSTQESQRLSLSLKGLDLDFVTELLFPSFVTENGSLVNMPEYDDMEENDLIRLHLRSGDSESARDQIEDLDKSKRLFYSPIINSLDQPLPELAKSMYFCIEEGELPHELQSELLFYLGCVAIEVGDYAVAVHALTESQQTDSQSALTPLRITYLQQLRSH